MYETIKIAVLKSIAFMFLAAVFLPVFSTLTVLQSLIIGLVLSFLTYLGNLVILPRTNNLFSTTADVFIALVWVWTAGGFFGAVGLSMPLTFLFALIVGIIEWLVHRTLIVEV